MAGATDLLGAWKRTGLIVGEVRCSDPCDVLWLQTEDWYADVRLVVEDPALFPGGPQTRFYRPWAFAGTADWDPPTMTWQHLLDSNPDSGPDSNPLELRGDLIIERGTFDWEGRPVTFCEEWSRISPRGVESVAEATLGAIRVTVGRWRISVSDERPDGVFRARRDELEDGVWQTVGSLEVPGPR